MVKDYQGNREYLVLSMVKKYPLYSLEKLSKELPGISRHSIQRILEKHNLSKVEDRLAFADEKKEKLLLSLPKISVGLGQKINFQGLKNLFGKKEDFSIKRIRLLPGFFLLFLILFLSAKYFFAQSPKITLEQPEENFANKSQKLFVKGKVTPGSSVITINNQPVSLNGDGSFTAVVEVPVGESVLKVEAVNKFNHQKRAQVLRLVSRVLTDGEVKEEEENTLKKKRAAADRAAELERTVNDLLAAKNAAKSNQGGKGNLKIMNNRIKEDFGFYSVVGEVTNIGSADVSWVMITANFSDKEGKTIDTKNGFATSSSQVIKPGETIEFEIQPTTKAFENYSLNLSWEEGVIAGAAIEITPTEAVEAVPSAGI